jgi:hypothetical protein
MSEEQILTDPNSPGWRYLRDNETVQAGDEYLNSECMWCLTDRVGEIAGPNVTYRRRIEQTETNQDDPSGDGWRWVNVGETLQVGDMLRSFMEWVKTNAAGGTCRKGGIYRRRIEPQQPQQADYPSDKERYQRLLEAVFAEAAEYKAKWQSCIKLQADYRSGELAKQTTHEVQQLREKVETLSDMVQQLISRLTPTLRSREQE